MESSKLPYFLQFQEDNEVQELKEATVTGQLPPWLKGTLVRNGSGVFQVGSTTVNHVFDGMACLHKFLLDSGTVRYQCRVLDSETWKRCKQAQCLTVSQFATVGVPDPCKSIFSRYFSYFFDRLFDNTSVNVVGHGDRLIAMTEASQVRLVDPGSLTSSELGTVDLSRVISVRLATAHPHFDSDGSMYNLGTDFNPRQAYSIIKVPPPSEVEGEPLEKAELEVVVPSRKMGDISYNHSFGMSQNYFVILEQTLTFKSLKAAFRRFTGSSIEQCLVDNEGEESLLHVLDRKERKEVGTRYAARSFFCFHFVNCFETEDFLVVDLVGYEDNSVIKRLYLNSLGSIADSPPRYKRFVLPLKVDQAEIGKNLVTLPNTQARAEKREDGSIFLTPDTMFAGEDAVMVELPRINDSRLRLPHRYVYGTSFVAQDSSLCKLDVEAGQQQLWREENFIASEPVFVPSPDSKEEDDGVVLATMMSRTAEDQSFLVVLDAKTFTERARATIPPGAKIPLSFHGSYL